MQAIIFETVGENGRKRRNGWIVPGTEELLVIDQRNQPQEGLTLSLDEQDWVITHLPTGFAVHHSPHTDAQTEGRAAGIARAFFRECKSLGVNLHDSEASKIVAKVNSMPKEDRIRFWERIKASEDFRESEQDIDPNAEEN